MNTFFLLIFLMFSVLIIRLADLQFVQSKQILKAENETQTQSFAIAPIRGRIYDRDGYPIAVTSSEQSLFFRVEPGQLKQAEILAAKQLAEVFHNYGDPAGDRPDAAEVLKRMDIGTDMRGESTVIHNYNWMPRRIKSRLSEREIAYIEAHHDQFPDFDISEESVRKYDGSNIAVQLVGYLRPYSAASNLDFYKNDPHTEYINDEYVGLDGLELMYQNQLRGQNGSKSYPVDKLGRIIGPVTIQPPVKGKNLYLTIQKDVQLDAQKAIIEGLKEINQKADQHINPFTGHHPVAGYAVAMEVDTGKVVAMASMPDYDPNQWQGGLSSKEYQNIQVNSENGTIRERYADLPDKLRAKQPSSLVPPGSTIKPLTVLLGLNEGLITPDETFNDPGCFYFGKNNSARVCNSNHEKFGVLNAASAIANSANTYMAAMVGNRLYMSSRIKNPVQVWDRYMKAFGLGVTTGGGLPGEISGDIYYFEDAKRYKAQSPLILGSFGQEARYTTLQLAQYCATLANHGKRMKPLFVDHITDYDNHALQQIKPQVLNETKFPAADWKVIEKGMSGVFVTGFDGGPRKDVHITGADGTKYPVLRKTGTSQSDIAGQLVENGVFIAYAPADRPKLAVAVVIPDGGYGSWSAAPIARKIFDSYDKYVGLASH